MREIASTIGQANRLVHGGYTQDALLAFLSRSGLTFPEAIKVIRDVYAIDLKVSRDICAAGGHWPRPEDTMPTWRFRWFSRGKPLEMAGDDAFDELAVSPWLHIERLNENYYGMRIGELATELTIEDGRVARWRRLDRRAGAVRR